MAESKISAELIARRIEQHHISCPSMVVNVFGDSVSQHGGWIWLGSLIEVLAPFGYNERLVRTAVYRLVQQDWLQVNKIGRRSFYCLTDSAKGHTEKAARRIYSAGQEVWDGTWTLVSPVFVPEEAREAFRKSLLWQGYGLLINGLFAHPSSDRTSLDETLAELDLEAKVIVFSATTSEVNSQSALKKLVKDKWNLAELQEMYTDFLDYYRPVSKNLNNAKQSPDKLSPDKCFLLRTLMIHDYRRILLRDPDFPDAMLPTNWIGFEAYELAKRLYKFLAKPSTAYIQNSLENGQGPMPAASPLFYNRFGGI